MEEKRLAASIKRHEMKSQSYSGGAKEEFFLQEKTMFKNFGGV